MEKYGSDIQKIEEFVQLKGKSLLDVGCGDGRITALLVDKAKEITAIDPDQSSIETARKNINGVNFLIGSGEELDFASESFDMVLFSYSLHHHHNSAKALVEARRVLRPDGQFLIIEPTHDGEFSRLVSIFEKNEVLFLQKTLDYITSGSFNILRKDTYCVNYPYADENELYTYFMTKFMTEKDDRAVEKMQEIVGDKNSDKPIVIQDIVNIFLIGR